jgi:hypothetical protein
VLKSATPMKLNQRADAGNKKSKFVTEFGLNYFLQNLFLHSGQLHFLL